MKYPWWWAHEGPRHVGKRREKGNKDIVQRVASVGNSYWNSTSFGPFLCPLSGVFHCTHSSGICRTGFLQTAVEQDQDGTSWYCSTAVCKPVWHIPLLCVQWKTPNDEQRNCPKHVELQSKKKFEKLVHLVGFIKKYYWSVDKLLQ